MTSTLASARFLSTTARRAMSSSALVVRCSARPSSSSFFQPILRSYDEQLGLVQNGVEEVVPSGELLAQLLLGIEQRVQRAAKNLLGSVERGRELGERDVANDDEVDVARRSFGATRNR